MDNISNNNFAIKNSFHGLTSKEIALSKQQYGQNILTRKKSKGFFKKLLQNFGDPMIRILLLALAINLVFLFRKSDWFETVGIALTILVATFVSTISEYGSEAAFEKLQQQAMNIFCRCRRNGQTVTLAISELVVGDIVLLGSGDKIPADGNLISGKIYVDQSALNGESKEAYKYSDMPMSVQKDTNELLNPKLLFSGTVVTSGDGVMEIARIGDNTYYGKIAAEIQDEPPSSPLKIKLEKLAKKISLFGYIGAALATISYLFNAIIISNNFDGVKILEMLKSWDIMFPYLLNAGTIAVTIIVMAVPEGLPMMITVVLSSNMKRMFKDNVLIRKLNGIETAGSMNILFTDKTGTLTNGKLIVTSIVYADGKIRAAETLTDCKNKLAELLSVNLMFNSQSEFVKNKSIGGNATDRALLDYAHTLSPFKNNLSKQHVTPFSSDTKFMATTLTGSKNITLIKGAPEKLLPLCTKFYQDNGCVAALGDSTRINNVINSLSQKSIRIVLIATSEHVVENTSDLKNLTFVALAGIKDQIRPEAVTGVKKVKAAGIQTVMITGDSKSTALAIAKEIGIVESPDDCVLTSDELAELSDKEVADILSKLRVVARALPSDKSRLVRLAQDLNLVVGMTGDGINDAPALKKADIGFAMGSGTEVAKEAGDIVILDDNFNSIAKAVLYGRTIFKSIRKFIIFQLSVNFCAVIVAIVAPMLGVDSPITVVQMLWINLVMDTLGGLAFSGERPRERYMLENPKNRDESLINKYMWSQIIFISLYSAAIALWFLKSPLINGMLALNGKIYFKTAFFTLFMFMAVFNSINVRTHEIKLFEYIAVNKQFICIMSAIAILQVFMIYFGKAMLHTVPISFVHLLLVVALALMIIPLDLLRKFILRKRKIFSGT